VRRFRFITIASSGNPERLGDYRLLTTIKVVDLVLGAHFDLYRPVLRVEVKGSYFVALRCLDSFPSRGETTAEVDIKDRPTVVACSVSQRPLDVGPTIRTASESLRVRAFCPKAEGTRLRHAAHETAAQDGAHRYSDCRELRCFHNSIPPLVRRIRMRRRPYTERLLLDDFSSGEGGYR